MARMLTALKNLEARGGRTAESPSLPRALPESRPPQAVEEVPPRVRPVRSATAPPVAVPPIGGTPAPPVDQSAPLELTAHSQTPTILFPLPLGKGRGEGAVSNEATLGLNPLSPGQKTVTPQRSLPLASSPTATSLERNVVRTLGDPLRAQPLVEMAERMRRDAGQTGGRTLLLVGVGKESPAHEAALYASAVLGQHEPVLLIDADLARQSLTDGFDRAAQPGLAELLQKDRSPRESCQPTALAGVSFLPGGGQRHVDLSASGPRLEEVIRRLAAEFSWVLVSGGRTPDLSASALARICDATYFVVQLGAVEAFEAQAALRDFRAAGARVLGCIAT